MVFVRAVRTVIFAIATIFLFNTCSIVTSKFIRSALSWWRSRWSGYSHKINLEVHTAGLKSKEWLKHQQHSLCFNSFLPQVFWKKQQLLFNVGNWIRNLSEATWFHRCLCNEMALNFSFISIPLTSTLTLLSSVTLYDIFLRGLLQTY